VHCIVILGGYGNFGSRIAAALAEEPNARVVIAGRDVAKATSLSARVGGNTEAHALDHQQPNLAERLRALGATLVVHTAGPFQAQSYSVARACIEAKCHYLDLADSRDFVANIGMLNEAAEKNGVVLVSGASTLPALSSAVIDKYRARFSKLQTIEYAISSGAQPPGIATMEAIMSYVGKPFQRWERNGWRTVHGWQDMTAERFPAPLGMRWLASCDVPDLELFPRRYPELASVIFRAGVGFGSATLAVWLLSWCVRIGFLRHLEQHSAKLHRAAKFIARHGSQWSAMRVRMSGLNAKQNPEHITWTLIAGDDHGPHIPTFPAIALTRKLIRGQITILGATPCIGLMSAEEILAVSKDLNLTVIESP
jgi:saccharopine dehydrogenase-like NADP-dependent oxidoreductase